MIFHGTGEIEQFDLLILAEIRGLEEFLQQHDLGALRGGVAHQRFCPGDILVHARRARELGCRHGYRCHQAFPVLIDSPGAVPIGGGYLDS
jgi:hypothetical protein